MTKRNKVEEVKEVIVTEEVKTEVTIPYNLEELTKELKTKSAIVRKLHSEGYNRSLISKFMNIRYQHVRNILVTPLKKVETKVEEENNTDEGTI